MPHAYYILESELDVSGDSMCQWDREGEDDGEGGSRKKLRRAGGSREEAAGGASGGATMTESGSHGGDGCD